MQTVLPPCGGDQHLSRNQLVVVSCNATCAHEPPVEWWRNSDGGATSSAHVGSRTLLLVAGHVRKHCMTKAGLLTAEQSLLVYMAA